jgi:hypothetical protein
MTAVFFHLSQNKLLLYDVCTAHWWSSEVSSASCPQEKLSLSNSEPACFISRNTEQVFWNLVRCYFIGSYRTDFGRVSVQRTSPYIKIKSKLIISPHSKKDWHMTKVLQHFMWFKFNAASLWRKTLVSMLCISVGNCIVMSSTLLWVPDEVIGFFNRPNPSSHTMAVGSTRAVTEMSISNLPGG